MTRSYAIVKRPSRVVIQHNSKKLSEIILRCRNVHLQEKTNDHRIHQAILLLVAAQKHLKRQRIRAVKRSYYLSQKSLISAQTQKKRQELRLKVLSHYSPTLSCQRCGIKDMRVLSIDHINSHGAKHREGKSFELYSWLKACHYPPGYQVLCMNCQRIKMNEKHEYPSGKYMALVPPITFLENSVPTAEQVAYEREHGNKYEDFEYNWHKPKEQRSAD